MGCANATRFLFFLAVGSLFVLAKGSLLKESPRTSTVKYVFIGAGGCDDDDPTCYEPDGTNLITTCSLDEEGQLEVIDTIGGIRDPAWLLLHPNKKTLYATETGGSGVWSLKVTNVSNGTNLVPSLSLGAYVDTGEAPVYLAFDITQQFMFVANYNGGSLSAVSLDSTGQVAFVSSQVQHYGHGIDPVRQDAPHVHGVFVTQYGGGSSLSLVYAMDLGLDRIFWYVFDPTTGILTNGTGGGSAQKDNFVYTTNLGSGPRHMTITTTNSGNRVAHVINELANTIESFQINDENGALTTSVGVVKTLPESVLNEDDLLASSFSKQSGNQHIKDMPSSPKDSFDDSQGESKASEILSSENGQWVYASNRGNAFGSDSIVTFSVDLSSGKLGNPAMSQAFYSGGSFPRGMELIKVGNDEGSSNGGGGLKLVVGGQDSDSVSVFDVSEDTGLINEMPQSTLTNIVTPVTFSGF